MNHLDPVMTMMAFLSLVQIPKRSFPTELLPMKKLLRRFALDSLAAKTRYLIKINLQLSLPSKWDFKISQLNLDKMFFQQSQKH